jgi:hypothetical protein
MTANITDVGPITLQNEEYQYAWMFLRPGSEIFYDFNSSGSVDFFIADANQLYIWDAGGSPSFYFEEQNTLAETDSYLISNARDYYVVWYNDGGSSVDVDFTVNFIATGIVNFSAAVFNDNQTDSTAGTFQVPSSGNWYFFVYFDPMLSEEETTLITFDVTYDTGKNSVERWLDIQWILIIILVVVVILLIAALIARRGQKKLKLKSPTETKPKTTQTTPDTSPYKSVKKTSEKEVKEPSKCIRCNAPLKPAAKFCIQCGGKVEGRKSGTPSIVTPATSKNCSLCGSKISGSENFCKWCGTKIET